MTASCAAKIHLEDGSCKSGERGRQVSHERFVRADSSACLTCARICGCAACSDLQDVFRKAVPRV